jgi:hypothetical protein
MKIWKLFSVLALSMLLVAMLAACEGGSSGGTTPSGSAHGLRNEMHFWLKWLRTRVSAMC